MTETCKQTPAATEAFMELVEDQIHNLRQKLAEAEEKIRILQENAGALIDQKAELVEANTRLADELKRQRTYDVRWGDPAPKGEEFIRVSAERYTFAIATLKRLQDMGIQQNEQDVLTHLRDEARSEHKRIKDEHLAALGIKDADVFQQLKPENAFKSRSEQGG